MLSQPTIPKKKTNETALDYHQLYAIGLKHVQQLSSQIWTDYNVHDPGITTLELLCYALTDLSYRTSFPIEDLLASESDNVENMKKQFFTARQILPNRPLTKLDYRKLLIDVPGVKNAWVELATQAYYADPVKGELLGTPTLFAEEIINLPSFAARLKQNSPDPISRYLFAQLSSATRQALIAYDGADPETEPLQTQLVQDLNLIIQGDAFSRYLLSQLRDDTRKALATHKEAEPEAEPLWTLLMRDLNLDIPNDDFYQVEWLREFTRTQSLMAQYQQATVEKRWTADISDRLNRLLLEDVYPESMARYRLLIEKIIDLPSFTAKLKQTSPDPVSRYLFEQLRDVTRQALAVYEGVHSEAQPLHTLLVEDLNRIVQGDSIYEEQRFSGFTLSPPTLGLIALQQQLNGDNLTKISNALNRLLLNDVYRLEIARYHPLRTIAALRSIKKVNLGGLYHVIIDYLDDIKTLDQKETVMGDVKQRLHANRNLGEDFVKFTEVETQSFQLCAELELTPDANVNKVNATILFQVQEYLSPSVRFYTLSEMLARQKTDGTLYPVDEIFEGPALKHGFIDDDELEKANLRTEIPLSDIISIIMDIEGVQAVRDIVINPEGNKTPLVNKWVIPVKTGKQARLNPYVSRLVFYKRNIPMVLSNTGATPSTAQPATDVTNDLAIPLGTYRKLASYYSFQNHFPAIYGLSDVGLSSAADNKRKALAYQLKAYLLFFDQLMANYLAQLSHVKELFSLNPELQQTYFYQVVNSFADYNKIYATNNVIDSLKNQNNEREEATGFERRNRFLDHLISRFAERFHDFVNIMYSVFGESPESIIRYKCEFLESYPTISQERSLAYNYSLKEDQHLWNTDNVSGLEKRLAKLLGIPNHQRRNLSDSDEDEGMYLIENILLRSEQNSDPFLPICPTPNCTDCAEIDPYSYRIQIILPAYGPRFGDIEFRRFAEEVIREETPAHILPKICWISKEDMALVEKLYRDWIYLKAGVETTKRQEKLREFIKQLFAVKNVYPLQKLSECDGGEDQPKFILGRTALGTGKNIET